MTYHYSVTFRSAREYFIESILDEKKLANNEIRELTKAFSLFFDYLKNGAEKLFYKYSCKRLLDLPNELIIGNETICLDYYTKNIKREYIRLDNARESITISKPSQILDLDATRRAKIPNIIHNTDSVFARKILCKNPMYIIHDEFLIPAVAACSVIDYINSIFPTYLQNEQYISVLDNELTKNTYSIFIII